MCTPQVIKREKAMKPLDLKRNGKYNFKNYDDQLIFIEARLESSGYWYVFARVIDPEGVKVIIRGGRVNDLEETVDEPAAEKCDGDHGGPKCVDPECWNTDSAYIGKLEATIKSLTDGVAHFNKSHGDMNPLLKAYIAALESLKL
jgi:hypothetical protein